MRGSRKARGRTVRAAIASRVARLRGLCLRWHLTLRQAVVATLLPLAGLVQQGFVVQLERSPAPLASPQAIMIRVEIMSSAGRITVSAGWTRPATSGMPLGETRVRRAF